MSIKVTLYIEDTEIKVLVTNNKKVDVWGTLLLEPDIVRDGVIIEEEQVAQKLRELFKLQKITEKKVTAAISGLNSIFRIISLPELPSSLIAEAVRNEADRVIPLPLDQTYLSYQLLPAHPGETRVYVVAHPKNATDALISTLGKAGLKLRSLDLAPLALCRSADTPKAIIVNSWLSYVDIAIIVDRIPQVVRSLSLPTESTKVKDKLPSISEELNRTIDFYNSGSSKDKIDSSVPLYVCGDLAREDKLWPELAGVSGYSVSTMPLPLEAPETFEGCQFVVNIGLALKDTYLSSGEGDYSIINFNAIPETHKTPSFSLFNIIAPILFMVIIGGLVYGWFYVQDLTDKNDVLEASLKTTESSVLALQQDIGALQGNMATLELALEPLAGIKDSLNATYSDLRDGRENIVEDIRKAVNLQPLTLNLTLASISHNGNSLNLSGVARLEDDIFNYARQLEKSGRFAEVVVSSITVSIGEEGAADTYAFNLSLFEDS